MYIINQINYKLRVDFRSKNLFLLTLLSTFQLNIIKKLIFLSCKLAKKVLLSKNAFSVTLGYARLYPLRIDRGIGKFKFCMDIGDIHAILVLLTVGFEGYVGT